MVRIRLRWAATRHRSLQYCAAALRACSNEPVVPDRIAYTMRAALKVSPPAPPAWKSPLLMGWCCLCRLQQVQRWTTAARPPAAHHPARQILDDVSYQLGRLKRRYRCGHQPGHHPGVPSAHRYQHSGGCSRLLIATLSGGCRRLDHPEGRTRTHLCTSGGSETLTSSRSCDK